MATKQPTRRELRTLENTLEDLVHYSKAHLGLTTKRPGGIGQVEIWGTDLFTWGDLNNAIHRAEEMLKARNGTP